MANGKKNQQQTKSRSQRRDEAERKRDERARRNALKKERETKQFYPVEDDENFVSFNNQLLAQSLKIKDIPGDGNCLFRALADQLEGDHQLHKKYRKEIVCYMQNHNEDFAPFIDIDTFESFEKYLESLGQDGTFAGNDAIVAFTRKNEVDVVIHQYNNPRFIVQGHHIGKPGMKIELHLAYHNGEHYSSLRRLHDPGTGPAYPYHAAKVESGHLENGSIEVTGKNKSKTIEKNMSRKHGHLRQNLEQDTTRTILTDEEQLIVSETKCEDMNLVKKAIDDHQGDVEGAITYVLQVMCLGDDQEETIEEACSKSIQPSSSTDASVTASQCYCDCEDTKDSARKDCECGCENTAIKGKYKPAPKNARQSAKKHNRPTQLTNRQRKELAKQGKKKRREESKREQLKESSEVDVPVPSKTSPPTDLGCVRI